MSQPTTVGSRACVAVEQLKPLVCLHSTWRSRWPSVVVGWLGGIDAQDKPKHVVPVVLDTSYRGKSYHHHYHQKSEHEQH